MHLSSTSKRQIGIYWTYTSRYPISMNATLYGPCKFDITDHPAANVLFFLNFSPNIHNKIGAGHPNVIAMNASKLLPQP